MAVGTAKKGKPLIALAGLVQVLRCIDAEMSAEPVAFHKRVVYSGPGPLLTTEK